MERQLRVFDFVFDIIEYIEGKFYEVFKEKTFDFTVGDFYICKNYYFLDYAFLWKLEDLRKGNFLSPIGKLDLSPFIVLEKIIHDPSDERVLKIIQEDKVGWICLVGQALKYNDYLFEPWTGPGKQV